MSLFYWKQPFDGFDNQEISTTRGRVGHVFLHVWPEEEEKLAVKNAF